MRTIKKKTGHWPFSHYRMNKSSMCKRDEQIFRRTNCLIFVGLERQYYFSQTICPSTRTSWWQYVINSHQTVKCQTICRSRWFVCPLVWKQPLSNAPKQTGIRSLVPFLAMFNFSQKSLKTPFLPPCLSDCTNYCIKHGLCTIWVNVRSVPKLLPQTLPQDLWQRFCPL